MRPIVGRAAGLTPVDFGPAQRAIMHFLVRTTAPGRASRLVRLVRLHLIDTGCHRAVNDCLGADPLGSRRTGWLGARSRERRTHVTRKKLALSAAVGAALVVGAVSTAAGAASTGAGAASSAPGLALPNVPRANPKSEGYAPASKLSRGLAQIVVAQGATRLENTSAL